MMRGLFLAIVALSAALIAFGQHSAVALGDNVTAGCGMANSGTASGNTVNCNSGLTSEGITRVVEELKRQGIVRQAEEAGIEPSIVASLAARLKPMQKLDFAQAVVEVSNAVDIAINVAKAGSRGSSDQLVDEVLKRIAEKTKANDPEGATHEADEGIARWEKQERERRASETNKGVALLEAALKTDLLRFDASAAAVRLEKIASLQHENDPKATLEAVHASWDQFNNEGEDKGVNFSLEVAIAIARREVELARDPNQHNAAMNDLGIALGELDEQERGKARLDQAFDAFRVAQKDFTRERSPLDWALTQESIGNALRALGDEKKGAARLNEAIAEYRAELDERARERVPLDWATTQNNLGNALRKLGSRESGTARLEEAVAAFRAALEERTRERVPLDWAMTQNNLGLALMRLGERESGTVRLEEAVEVFRASLEERTRERLPLQWASTYGSQGIAIMLIADRTNDQVMAETAVEQIKTVAETLRAYDQEQWAAYYEQQLPKAQAIRDRLKGK